MSAEEDAAYLRERAALIFDGDDHCRGSWDETDERYREQWRVLLAELRAGPEGGGEHLLAALGGAYGDALAAALARVDRRLRSGEAGDAIASSIHTETATATDDAPVSPNVSLDTPDDTQTDRKS